MDHAFGNGEPFLVGIEEELFLVDPDSGALSPDAGGLLEGIDGSLRHRVSHEIYACEVELRSSPSRSAAEAGAELARLRAATAAAGAHLLGAGLYPDPGPEATALVETDRADVVRADMRGLIERTPECALHVHVGAPDPETAVAIHNGLRSWLPLLCALSANSPFWFGRDSGLASARRAITRAYPGRGVPDALRDFAHYEERLDAIAAAGGPEDYTLLWWDIRLHPKLGTVEIREMDARSRVGDAAALAALIRGLAVDAAQSRSAPLGREELEWSMFRAMRDGVEAEIAHEDATAPVAFVARAAIDAAGPHAAEAGDSDLLAGIEPMLDPGAPARARSTFARAGMSGLIAELRSETSAPYP